MFSLPLPMRAMALATALFAVGIPQSTAEERPSRSGFSSVDINKITDVLSSDGCSTVIPKRSILHLPQGLEGKIARKPNQTYSPFSAFYRKNQVWLYKMEISIAEARGDVEIDPAKLARAKTLGKMVIAVRNGNPISVRIPKKPALEAKVVEIRR